VAQGLGLEFKHQYHQKQKKKEKGTQSREWAGFRVLGVS
jgi:hypothetical protein